MIQMSNAAINIRFWNVAMIHSFVSEWICVFESVEWMIQWRACVIGWVNDLITLKDSHL